MPNNVMQQNFNIPGNFMSNNIQTNNTGVSNGGILGSSNSQNTNVFMNRQNNTVGIFNNTSRIYLII